MCGMPSLRYPAAYVERQPSYTCTLIILQQYDSSVGGADLTDQKMSSKAADTLDGFPVRASRTGTPYVVPVVNNSTCVHGLCHTRRVFRPGCESTYGKPVRNRHAHSRREARTGFFANQPIRVEISRGDS
jgi:hypothetical protein